MADPTKRLMYLEKVTQDGSTDPFTWYALALEYRSHGRHADALATFEALRARSPEYLPMYLLAGQLLKDMSREEDARAWLEEGFQKARAQGNSHTASEIEALLGTLG